jgi:hypothetical protein
LLNGFSLPCHYLVKISPGKLVAEDTPERNLKSGARQKPAARPKATPTGATMAITRYGLP